LTQAHARLAQLTIRDFRNIAHAELAPAADGIAVVGENGHGKTNLIEAIAYLRLLRSMRGARDREVRIIIDRAEGLAAAGDLDGRAQCQIHFVRCRQRIHRTEIDDVHPKLRV